jgi:hypothetical protein
MARHNLPAELAPFPALRIRQAWLALAATVLVAISSPSALAGEKNGLQLSVSKTTLDRDTGRNEFYDWDRVDKALGLKCEIKNTGIHPRDAGELKYAVVVKRWGYGPARYERYEGTETLAALKPAEDTKMTVGKVPLGGYESHYNRKQFMDSIEAWQVVILHSGTETISAKSTSFDKLYEKSQPAESQRK